MQPYLQLNICFAVLMLSISRWEQIAFYYQILLKTETVHFELISG